MNYTNCNNTMQRVNKLNFIWINMFDFDFFNRYSGYALIQENYPWQTKQNPKRKRLYWKNGFDLNRKFIRRR